MKKTLLISTLLIISLSVIGCVKKTAPATQHYPTSTSSTTVASTSRANQPSTTSTLRTVHQVHTIQGSTLIIGEKSNGFTFPQYQGKIVLLQIFGKNCPHCFNEMPIITRLQRTYAQRLQVIALQAEDAMSRSEALTLIQKFQMHYPIVDQNEARDILLFIRDTYEWRGTLPYTLIIKNGVTEFSYLGEVSSDELERDLRTLL